MSWILHLQADVLADRVQHLDVIAGGVGGLALGERRVRGVEPDEERALGDQPEVLAARRGGRRRVAARPRRHRSRPRRSPLASSASSPITSQSPSSSHRIASLSLLPAALPAFARKIHRSRPVSGPALELDRELALPALEHPALARAGRCRRGSPAAPAAQPAGEQPAAPGSGCARSPASPAGGPSTSSRSIRSAAGRAPRRSYQRQPGSASGCGRSGASISSTHARRSPRRASCRRSRPAQSRVVLERVQAAAARGSASTRAITTVLSARAALDDRLATGGRSRRAPARAPPGSSDQSLGSIRFNRRARHRLAVDAGEADAEPRRQRGPEVDAAQGRLRARLDPGPARQQQPVEAVVAGAPEVVVAVHDPRLRRPDRAHPVLVVPVEQQVGQVVALAAAVVLVAAAHRVARRARRSRR